MADFEEYSLMEKMVVGESLLWQLGMSRRWSTRANTWVVNGAPITANDFASRRLGVDVDNMPNGIMEYWLPKAMADLDGVEPERRLWLGDPSPATRTQTASDPPPDEQITELDKQCWKQLRARIDTRAQQGRVTDWSNITIPQNQQLADWESYRGLDPVAREHWVNDVLATHPDQAATDLAMSGEAAEQGATSQQGAQTAISSGLNAPDTLPPRPALPPNTGRLPQSSMPDLILDRRSYNWINIQRLILDCRSYDPVYGGSYAHWFQTRRFDRLRIVSLGRYKLYTEPIYGQLDPGANGLILSFWATCGRLVEQNRHIDGILPGQEGQAGDGGVYDFGQVDMWGNPGVHEKHLGKCDGQDVSDDEVADLLDLLFHNYAAQGYLP